MRDGGLRACRDLAEGVARRVNRFFQTVVIEFTLKCVEADTYVQELLQTLCRLFTVAQKPFYSRYGTKGGEVRPPFILSPLSLSLALALNRHPRAEIWRGR